MRHRKSVSHEEKFLGKLCAEIDSRKTAAKIRSHASVVDALEVSRCVLHCTVCDLKDGLSFLFVRKIDEVRVVMAPKRFTEQIGKLREEPPLSDQRTGRWDVFCQSDHWSRQPG